MSNHPSSLVSFEGYVVDRARWQLHYGEDLLPLHRKTFDLLLYLIDHSDSVVSKEELLHALWPESFVEENNLTQQVFMLRRALSRHGSGVRIIETTPGRGYRFVAATTSLPRPGIQEDNGNHVPKTSNVWAPAAPSGVAPGITVPAGQEAWTELGALPEAGLAKLSQSNQRSSDRSPGVFASPRIRWLLLALGLVGLYLAVRAETSRQPGVSAYAKITHDGHAKYIGGTDGSRIYFTRPETSGIWQVSVSGGPESPIPVAIDDPWSGEVSPDGSTLLVISQAAGQGPASTLWTLQLIGQSLRKVGNAVSAAWSPDGERIVYASANGDLSVMRRDGGEARRIASPGGYMQAITWSPDGDNIRFSRDGVLWQISPDGSHLRQLLPGWGESATQWSGGWAPDGSFYFVADGQIWSMGSGRGLFSTGPITPVQLTSGPVAWDRPVPGPDGKRIFASGRTRRGEVVRYDPQSGQLAAFLGGVSAEFVIFSPTGKSVAYVSYPEGILWKANLDGSNPVQLTEPPVYPKSICQSPDGAQIAFVNRTAKGLNAIFIIAADGSGRPHRLIDSDTEPETDPSWSPDGGEIAYSTSANVGASAKSDLRVYDLATHRSTTLPASDGLLVPRWSPDGRTIAAMTLDTEHLKLFNVASATWQSLDTGAVAFPEWSHDGHSIYYVRWTADPALIRMRVPDGHSDVLATLKGTQYTGTFTLWMGLDPDDRPMMLRDLGTDDIYALTLQR